MAIDSRLFNLTVKKTKERNMKITDNENLTDLIVFLLLLKKKNALSFSLKGFTIILFELGYFYYYY